MRGRTRPGASAHPANRPRSRVDPASAIAATAAFAPRESEFPQLTLAKDSATMLDLFRTYLRPTRGRAYRIEDCTPFRFRYHPYDGHWVLQYALPMVEARTGRRWTQWVTGLLFAHPGHTERLWNEVRAGDPAGDIPPEWRTFEPVAYVPELQMLLEVFPFDWRLRHLSQVLNGGMRQLDELVLARLGRGPWRAANHTIQPRQYRAELGAVLVYTMHAREARSERTASLRCYLKVYGNERGKDALRVLRTLSRKTEASSRPYGVTPPIAYLDGLRTLAVEEAQGTSLDRILLEESDPRPALRRVARAVAALNRDRLPITRRRPLPRHLATLYRAAVFAQWACPEARDAVRAINAAVVEHLVPVPPHPTHGDLKPDHIFLADERTTFIDIDSAALGDPVRDPARLFVRIASRLGLDGTGAARASAAAAEFRDEYFRHVPSSWRDRFAFHTAGCSVEVSGEFFKRQDPGWHERMLDTIQLGQRALSGALG